MRSNRLLALTLLIAACTGKDRLPADDTPRPAVTDTKEASLDLQELTPGQTGLEIRLTEVEKPTPEGGSAASAPLAELQRLPDDRVEKLVARLPDIDAAERVAFKLREGSKPPPRAGEEVQEAWPPPPRPDVAPDIDAGTLTVRRFAPEGEVSMAPHLSVTFSQPMVAVTSQDEASKTIPVQLDPEPPGHWRWLGTRTLLFDPDPRLPMATEYTATIPKGTKSALGGTLDEEVSFTFATPPLDLRSVYPSGNGNKLDTVMVLSFDQKVEPSAVLPFIHLRGGSTDVPVELATEAQIAGDETARRLVDTLEEGRWIALAPKTPLQPGTPYQLELSEGAPSAEGPRPTPSDQTHSWRTYDPLKVVDDGCWTDNRGRCNPDGALWIRVNNNLDEDSAARHISVEPAPPGMAINVSGSYINISGDLPARSEVTVTLDAELLDTFEQSLGKTWTRKYTIGPASELLSGPNKDQVVLDPTGPAAYPVYSRNHEALRVQVFSMQAEDFGKLSKWYRERRYDGTTTAPPLKRVFSGRIDIDDYTPDELVENGIDLSPYLKDDHGQLFVWVQPLNQPKERWQQVHLMSWVQRTNIGLTAFHDGQQMLAWATDLATGEPLPGVEVSLLGSGQGSVTTDADGLARMGPYAKSTEAQALVARKDGDVAVLPEQMGWWNQYGSWVRHDRVTSLRWGVFDDRAMYKPKETVRLKGWVRPFHPAPGRGLERWESEADQKLTWKVYDTRNVELTTGTVDIDALGGFDLSFDLPESPNLGAAYVRLETTRMGISQSYHHAFQIQEFRRPEYEVSTTIDPRPYVLGEHAIATVNANYYSGEPLPGAQTRWSVRSSAASHTPPGHPGFQFGPWSPWWWWGPMTHDGTTWHNLEGTTSGEGSHSVRMDFLASAEPRPYSVTAEATVFDVNRQRWTSSSTLLVHPSELYVGMKSDRPFVNKGDKLEFDLLVTDIEGKVQPGVQVDVRIARMVWKKTGGEWKQVAENETPCAVTSAEEAVQCTLTPDVTGQYRARAEVKDSEGRLNRTDVNVYVGGGTAKPNRDVAMEQVILVPGAESFEVGGKAEIMVQAPFWPADGLVTLRQDGLFSTERIHLDGPTTTLSFDVDERWIPNLQLEVDLVGSADRTNDEGEPMPDAERRVAYASGGLSLSVPPVVHTLDVQLNPARSEVDPGASTAVDVVVTDAAGKPVADAEVALWMVDEAVLALSSYTTPDLLNTFYAGRGAGVSEAHLRERVVLADPESVRPRTSRNKNEGGLGLRGSGVGGGGATSGAMDLDMEMAEADAPAESSAAPPPPAAAPMKRKAALGSAELQMAEDKAVGQQAADTPIALRTDFRALALFAPRVRTDASGKARVEVDLPDNLTRYRVMAVAVDDGVAFGHADANVTARKPLMLRPSPPRFLNVGDKTELPLVVQNPTGADVTVNLAVRVDNAKVLADMDQDVLDAPDKRTMGVSFVVPAEDRREVRIPVGVVDAGTLRFQAVVASSDATDAATDEFPVWTPATTEAFATYGSVTDGGMVQPVQAPPDAWPQYGGLEITTSSTQLQTLTDALLYLNQYPFECTEQISSRVLANAALRDVLDAFEAEQLPPAEELAASVKADMDRLKRRQRNNGGFALWGNSDVYPWASLHATHALVRAEDKGWDVDGNMKNRAMNYTRNVQRYIPSWYSERARWTIRAYAVYIRHRAGDDDLDEARWLYRRGLDKLPLEAQAWILPTLNARGAAGEVDAILRNLDNKAVETAAAATFSEAYTDANDYVLLHSSRRTDGVILESLLEVKPKHDLNEKVVRGLLGHRTRGRWTNTQENAFILLAMDRYFRVYEGVTPDFIARVWIDDGFAGDHTFKGRTTERSHIDVPMTWLADAPGERKLTLSKEGEGRLYYRVGLRYAPRSLVLEPADHGFAVERKYEAVDDPEDVKRDADGTWRIKAGARVRVRVEMVAESRRTMVALVDPLPGGFEPMNPSLAVTGSIPQDPDAANTNRYWWWSRPWYSHQNLRDERAEAFTEYLWAGVHEYTYVATATTPGRYVVPPPKAEEMYHPETFGRGASARVIIE